MIEKSRGFEIIEYLSNCHEKCEMSEKAAMIIENFTHTEESFQPPDEFGIKI